MNSSANRHHSPSALSEALPNSFLIRKFCVVLKVIFKDGRQFWIEPYHFEPHMERLARRLADIQENYAQFVLDRYKGSNCYVALLSSFDNLGWQIMQNDEVPVPNS